MPGFAVILGPVPGIWPKTFIITAPRAVSYHLTCRGHGLVWLRTVPAVGGIGVNCDAGAEGSDWLNLPAADVGRPVKVRITGPAGTSWLLRIDGSRAAQPEPG